MGCSRTDCIGYIFIIFVCLIIDLIICLKLQAEA